MVKAVVGWPGQEGMEECCGKPLEGFLLGDGVETLLPESKGGLVSAVGVREGDTLWSHHSGRQRSGDVRLCRLPG